MEKQNELLINESKSNNLAVKSNKQIEEMRKDVASIHRFFLEDDDYEILDDYIADMLFEKGYRKADEIAREIFEELELKAPFFCENQIAYEHFYEELAELKKKYTQEK